MTQPNAFDLSDVAEAAESLVPTDPLAIGVTYGRTDWDNGRRLALYEGASLRYVNDRDEWYRWCQDRWCPATRGDQIAAAARTALMVDREARLIDDPDERARHVAFAQACLGESRLRAFITAGTGNDELRTDWSDFNASPRWFNAPNCTFDPLTLEWHTHTPRDYITKLCPTAWVPDAESGLLNDFITHFLPDRAEREYVVQVLAVAALSHGNEARRLVLLLGPTSTGKSTLMDLLKRTVGDDYVASVNPSVFRGNLDDKPRPDIMRALQARLILAFEASERWELHGDQIKRMTGGDAMAARAMRSDVMHEVNAPFVPVIVANEPPHIRGADDALRRRLVALSMDVQVDESDDGALRQQLVRDDGARRALLALFVRTYHECKGRMPTVEQMPQRFAEKTFALFGSLDDVQDILHSLLEDGSVYPVHPDLPTSHFVQSSVLHRCYIEWLRRHGTRQQNNDRLTLKQFTQRLRSLGYELRPSNGQRVVGWCLGDTSTTSVARF